MRLAKNLGRQAVLALVLGLMPACGGSVSSYAASSDGGSGNEGSSPDSAAPDSTAPDSSTRDSGLLADAPLDASDASPADAGGVPIYHRPDDSQCAPPAPMGSCPAGIPEAGPFECVTDSQCTSGAQGRCIQDGPIPGCHCTYDACAHDTDCPAGQLCVCHGSGYMSSGNTCMPGDCRVDSDCGAGGYCSPTHGSMNCGEVTGYYCHTPADLCTNDSDCSGMPPGPGINVCAWSSANSRWECQVEQLCG